MHQDRLTESTIGLSPSHIHQTHIWPRMHTLPRVPTNAAGRFVTMLQDVFQAQSTERSNTNLYVWNGLLCSSPHIAAVPVAMVCLCVASCVCEDHKGMLFEKCPVTVQRSHTESLIYSSRHVCKYVNFDSARPAWAQLTHWWKGGETNKQSGENPHMSLLQGSKVWWRPTRIAFLKSSCTGPPTSPQSSRKWPPLPPRRCTPKRPWWESE